MAHPIRGLLIGPLVVPLGYWSGTMVSAWISNFHLSWCWLRAAPVVVAGALGGAIVALGFAWMQQNAVMRVHMPVSGGAALGALAGALCWWAGQARKSKSE